MDPRQYQLAQQIFLEICDLPPGERTRHLLRACGSDDAVAAAVRAMLEADGQQCAIELEESDRLQLMQLLEPDEESEASNPLPQQIGPYHVLRRIGQGGMGSVYEAQQEQPRRTVAVKVLRRGDNTPAMLRRFRREIELLGRLQHPGIAQIYGAGIDTSSAGGEPYFAMEYFRGEPLTRFAKEHELSIQQKLSLLARICDAVHFAHQKGVLHRDLKPANILVARSDATRATSDASVEVEPFVAKILDFGIARALDQEQQDRTMSTDAGQIIGTVGYMSPEQMKGNAMTIDIRTDVYSLGVLMFELLSGQLPHDVRSRSLAQAARMIAFDPPTRLGTLDPRFKGDLEAIVHRALEPEPARRYPSASELAADIRRYLAREPVAARPLTALYQLSRFTQRNRGLVLGCAAAAIAMVLGITGTSLGLYRSLHAQHRAMESEARARRESYCVALAAADAISGTDPVRAAALLDAAPREFRGWEWNHYRNRLDHRITTIEGTQDAGAAVAIHPTHGPIAAVVRNGAIVVVALTDGSMLSTCSAPGRLTSPSLARTGSTLTALCTDAEGRRTLFAFDVLKGEVVGKFPLSASATIQRSISPRGRLVSIEQPGSDLRIIDLASGQILHTRAPAAGQTRREVNLAKEGFVSICTWTEHSTAVEAFEVQGGSLHQMAEKSKQASLPLDAGAKLAIANPRESLDRRVVEVVAQERGDRVSLLQGHSGLITAAVLSADETVVATAANDQTVRLFDAATGRCREVISVPNTVLALELSPDGGTIACVDELGDALLLSIEDPCVKVLRGHRSFVYHAAFSIDGSLIASSSWDDGVRLWNAANGQLVAMLDRGSKTIHPPSLMGFTRDGASIFCIEQSGVTSVWNLAAIQQGLLEPEASSPLAQAIAADPWKLALPSARWVRLEGGQVRAVSASGRVLVRGDGSGGVVVTDSSGATISNFAAASSEVTAMAISPDDTMAVTSGDGGTVRLWDLKHGTLVRTLSRHTDRVYSLDFCPDGSRLASGGNDSTVIIWDTKSWEPLAELRGHTQYVNAVSFSPDGTKLVSASGDGTVRIWDSLGQMARHQPSGISPPSQKSPLP